MTTVDEALAELSAPGAPYEIREQTINGRTMRAFAVGPHNFAEMVHLGHTFGDREWIVYQDERYTFEQCYRIISGLAHELRTTYGIRPGDRVAIAARNYPEFLFFFWAVPSIGAVLVPLNAWWSVDEMVYGIEDSGAVALAVDGDRLALLRDRLPGLGLRGVVSLKADEDVDGVERWEDVRARFDPAAELPEVEIEPEDLATILYTSGTTGRARGVPQTHRNHQTDLLNMVIQAAALGRAAGVEPDPAAPQPATLANMPFFHISQMISVVTTWNTGGKLVATYKWDPELSLELIEREHITAMSGVPLMVTALLNSPSLKTRDLSSLVSYGFAATAAPPERVLRIRSEFGGRVAAMTGYGMTEATGAVTLISGEEYWAHPDSVGKPMPVNVIKIVDEKGREVPTGETGELLVSGPNVVTGYWHKPEDSAKAFVDGWHRSGDIARLDEEGRVYLVDRMKDIVIRAGENVYCGEVEAVLYEHPAVHTAVVIGLPHERLGEEVAAVVRLQPGTEATAEDLQQHVRGRLAGFKVPSTVLIVDTDVPRTATGKVLKRELRDRVAADLGR
ncbi:class I adenylate-forming enzyme family protein [Pseudonocardia sp. RS010]|uniref:class I adenylate-forming enzyme family protein n=1 Tax=Pseudonocardia sp. RS010 TaxID=3385979 RepID=UPI0039A121F8